MKLNTFHKLVFNTLITSVSLFSKYPLDQATIQQLTQPVIFSRTGLELFFLETFNAPQYTENILPAHFAHLLDFLAFSQTIKEPREFVTTVFEIFHTRSKDCLWTHPLAFSLLLDKLPQYLTPLCTLEAQDHLEASVKKVVYKRVLAHYTQLLHKPFEDYIESLDDLVSPLTLDITELIKNNDKLKPITELQQIVTRFVESGLQKLIWDPASQEDSWNSVHFIADQLTVLYEEGIIPSHKILNQMYWSLLYRYGYFLKTAYDLLKPETFATIKHDLSVGNHYWLDAQEQEQFLTSKRDYLKHTLWECEVQRQTQALH